jgi:mannose/fructose/N-acetylgalactosamine-specific phosphotransferase system component IID
MRLGFARTVKLTLSSFFIQTSWSFTSLQHLGFLFTLSSGTHNTKQTDLLNTTQTIFNTHPYMAPYIIGAVLRAQDDNTFSMDRISRFISIAQTSFASAGDLLFWQTIRPALLLGAVILGLKFGIIGPIASLIVYSVFHLFHRIKGFQEGYDRGTDIIYVLRARRFILVQRTFDFLGALFTGGLVTLLGSSFNALLFIPLCLIFVGLMFKRSANAIIIVVAIIATMAIVILV